MDALNRAYSGVLQQIANAARQAPRPAAVRLLAVSKTKPAAAIRALAALGQRAFGENYVQEAVGKQAELADLALEWHLIGHLQSNKAREAATHFDWVQTVDRAKLVDALDRHRPETRDPLNVLIQVNIDDEASKSGCAPADIAALAARIGAAQRLRLRGLMAIPAPDPDVGRRRESFRRLKARFDALAVRHPGVDTLSMGMSEDFDIAIEEGATLVRVGTALFGGRPSPQETSA